MTGKQGFAYASGMGFAPLPALPGGAADADLTGALSRALEHQACLGAALARSEAWLQLVAETVPVFLSYFDPREIYTYSNEGYARWFGLEPADVEGQPIARVIGQKAYESVQHHILRALSGESVTHEYPMRRGREMVHARSTLVPDRDADGKVVGCFVLSYDITEQRRMQAALVQAQKMEAIGQLTGGLAHDFNNLLTIILGNLSALEERHPGSEEIRDLVAPALQAARQGAQLIRGLLSFSRRQSLAPKVVDVGVLINGMETLIRRSMPSSISLGIHLPETPLHVAVDRGQLESALLNFALNAKDAMPQGGRLLIRALPSEVGEVLAQEFQVQPGSYVLIEVIDSGSGMDPEVLERVFEPFFTTKAFGCGSGLGLSMVYGFVKQSGGGVRVRSEPGQGTTMAVLLPMTLPPEPVQPPVAEPARRPVGGQPRLVLLVEDEPGVRKVVRQQLVDLGLPVLEAENGQQALEILEQVADVQILLSDVVMPGGLHGRELARKARVLRPELHIVLMTGYEEQPEAEEMDGHKLPLLGKPFSRNALAQALEA